MFLLAILDHQISYFPSYPHSLRFFAGARFGRDL